VPDPEPLVAPVPDPVLLPTLVPEPLPVAPDVPLPVEPRQYSGTALAHSSVVPELASAAQALAYAATQHEVSSTQAPPPPDELLVLQASQDAAPSSAPRSVTDTKPPWRSLLMDDLESTV
jgi:hypothetical protein